MAVLGRKSKIVPLRRRSFSKVFEGYLNSPFRVSGIFFFCQKWYRGMMPSYIHSAREEKAKTMEMDFEQVIRRWILLDLFRFSEIAALFLRFHQ